MSLKLALQILAFLCVLRTAKSQQYINKVAKQGEISFGNFYETAQEKGAFLLKLGALMSNHSTQSIDECYFKCVENHMCLSVNVFTSENSQFHCQLLNWVGSNFESFLVKKPNSWYMPMKTACDPNTCVNDGNCTAKDGGKNYTCTCTSLSSGRNCETKSPCFLSPCKHGGQCTPTEDERSYNCSCTANFIGKHCECALFDFESGRLDGWTKTGTAFDNQPTYGAAITNSNLKGNWLIGTYYDRPNSSYPAGVNKGNGPTGTLTSPTFQIQGTKLKFLLAGPNDINKARIELLIGGSVVMKTARISTSNTMIQKEFDVTSYRGQMANIRLVDDSSQRWGMIMADNIEDSCDS